ncbi:universal stress protein [Gordonia sp. LSe1-13]|uniref:Universal stress protein n=1 Tax=Gordonia sesuvii TaxID=3116777 RepID=A0ABU7ME36_9ACTN|nr:universal stress protein [Gordonia sp. LSe1-13]MEE3851367.1 universal stress protein [Gordonia sp. LSe1-13]
MALGDDAVVVAVDGSENALVATRWAAGAAKRENLPLTVVCAFENPPIVPTQGFLDNWRAESQQAVDDAAQVAAEVAPGVKVTAQVVESRPSLLLQELSSRAKMLVVGSRGRGGVAGLLLGSVSTYISAHADCPVVVVPSTARADAAGPVVVGVDGSQVSRVATAAAFQQAQLLKTSLVAVNGFGAMSGEVIGGRHLPPQQQIHDDAEALVTGLVDEFRADYPDVDVTTVVEAENSAQSIVKSADDAQLVVLGNRGRGGFRGLLLGSTTQSVLHVTKCPVMVVHTQ